MESRKQGFQNKRGKESLPDNGEGKSQADIGQQTENHQAKLDQGQVRKQVRTGHGTRDWFQIRKGIHQGCILSPCLFNLYAEYIRRKAGLEEAQAEITIAGEISITSDM